ncbi:MAG TPA: hypothetical protein VFM01_09820 [Nakamurella sp.]|nr:hypothetical protein [Nakamurella sp.]
MNLFRTRTGTPVRRLSLLVVAALALLTALVPQAFADPGHHEHGSAAAAAASHGEGHAMPAPRTAAELAFHDQMRKLWEDHVTWTRLAIVTFAAGTEGFDTTAARLLQNQVDIGDAIKPFYGDAAGDQLTALLHDHITIAVEVMQAAKDGDTDAFNDANARWYDNANQIADFLAAANPRFWPDDVMRVDMKLHLDQTLTEAADELQGNYEGSVTEYEAVHAHILAMADMLSAGIIGQFPGRFH